MTAAAENADGLTLPMTNVASSDQRGLTTWYVEISNMRNKTRDIPFRIAAISLGKNVYVLKSLIP